MIIKRVENLVRHFLSHNCNEKSQYAIVLLNLAFIVIRSLEAVEPRAQV